MHAMPLHIMRGLCSALTRASLTPSMQVGRPACPPAALPSNRPPNLPINARPIPARFPLALPCPRGGESKQSMLLGGSLEGVTPKSRI
jgi:hypothetical protein